MDDWNPDEILRRHRLQLIRDAREADAIAAGWIARAEKCRAQVAQLDGLATPSSAKVKDDQP